MSFAKGKTKKAFTMAEVLITIGIIGVVAAMTLPSVINKYRKQETVARLKKAYTIINQALKLSEAANGEYQYWESGYDLGAVEYLKKYWLPYFKVDKLCTTYSECGYSSNYPFKYLTGTNSGLAFTGASHRIPFITTDGILYSISIGSGGGSGSQYTASIMIYIDINGPKGTNTYGKDYFMFVRTDDKGIKPYGYNTTTSKIESSCSKSGTGEYCAQKIMQDGWEIKDDYPW